LDAFFEEHILYQIRIWIGKVLKAGLFKNPTVICCHRKKLIGFLYPEEIVKIFNAVNLKTHGEIRNYTILHLLYDSGARASEIASLQLDYFDPENRALSILGKGNRYRIVHLWPKTTSLVTDYILNYRTSPIPLFGNLLFINQWKRGLTRPGINKLCKKYLSKALSSKRIKDLSPVHSFRHYAEFLIMPSNIPHTGGSLAVWRFLLGIIRDF